MLHGDCGWFHDGYLAGLFAKERENVGSEKRGIDFPDCPSDAFATAASPGRVTGWAVAERGIAPILGVAVAGGGTGKGTGMADRKLDA